MNAAVIRAQVELALGNRFPRALTVPTAPPVKTVSTGIAGLDALTGGIPRGALTEIVGPASSGRTGILHRAMASVTQAGEFCALVDATDSFDPMSAQLAGVRLDQLLWIRCSAEMEKERRSKKPPKRILDCLEQALRVADLLLQSGGFGLIALDMGNVPPESARRVPLTTWFRFRRVVEKTPAILLVLEPAANARTCASLVLQMQSEGAVVTATSMQGPPTHAKVFQELHTNAGLVRSQSAKKPVQPAHLVARAFSNCG